MIDRDCRLCDPFFLPQHSQSARKEEGEWSIQGLETASSMSMVQWSEGLIARRLCICIWLPTFVYLITIQVSVFTFDYDIIKRAKFVK